jgi:hypothetical protein
VVRFPATPPVPADPRSVAAWSRILTALAGREFGQEVVEAAELAMQDTLGAPGLASDGPADKAAWTVAE